LAAPPIKFSDNAQIERMRASLQGLVAGPDYCYLDPFPTSTPSPPRQPQDIHAPDWLGSFEGANERVVVSEKGDADIALSITIPPLLDPPSQPMIHRHPSLTFDKVQNQVPLLPLALEPSTHLPSSHEPPNGSTCSSLHSTCSLHVRVGPSSGQGCSFEPHGVLSEQGDTPVDRGQDSFGVSGALEEGLYGPTGSGGEQVQG